MLDLFEELRRKQRELDALFGSAFGEPLLLSHQGRMVKQPAADVQETDKEVIATFDLPGVEKGDISLTVDENSITIKAEKKIEKKEEKKGYFHQERSYSSFYRSFTLPVKIIPDRTEAEYKNGVLTVKMPKKEITPVKRKEIEVKVK